MASKNEPTNLMPGMRKNSLLKSIAEHITLTSRNYRLEKMLLQELREKMI